MNSNQKKFLRKKEKKPWETLKVWMMKFREGKFSPPLIYLLRRFFSFSPHTGIEVMNKEWDYLIILDACRYDKFKEITELSGKLDKKISKGSSTEEWLKRNFSEYYEDTIYVSSNPFIASNDVMGFNASDHFYKIEEVWKYGWDEGFGTVFPNEVTKAAIRIDKKFPNKRKIIHYLQPHAPFIGATRLLRSEIHSWTDPKVKKAWEDNLKLVLKEVKRLLKKIEGRIIISSDHGDCFGYLLSGHPWGIYVKELVEIPWFSVYSLGND